MGDYNKSPNITLMIASVVLKAIIQGNYLYQPSKWRISFVPDIHKRFLWARKTSLGSLTESPKEKEKKGNKITRGKRLIDSI